MERRELVADVAERADVRQEVADRVLKAFASIAAKALVDGEDVPLGGTLGKLIVRKKNGRLVVDFKPSKAFNALRGAL